ncbi:unnamed protein product [Clonostachys rosea]|uniref:Uncharacterized protein n=1 Tax=Bionectria ochroleuca TaxID=29856 RepID=A0ABY6UDB5_BIOOC|nr:unnamed protein product [Clonostachys rosea]
MTREGSEMRRVSPDAGKSSASHEHTKWSDSHGDDSHEWEQLLFLDSNLRQLRQPRDGRPIKGAKPCPMPPPSVDLAIPDFLPYLKVEE